ncbi:MAG TPA: hypothetical protein VIX84_01490 [Acidimicrobiales bacterium]
MACSDFKVVSTHEGLSSTNRLPPIGFSHQYGPSPVAARDAVELERWWFSKDVFWEVYLLTTPAKSGFVALGDASAVRAARRAVTSVSLTVATEDPHTIDGLLAYAGDPGPETYAEQLMQAVRALGYDNVADAQVHIYFGEPYLYATLTWSRSGGYNFDVVLKGDRPAPGATPLPEPTPPPPPPTPPTTSP